MNLKKGVTLRYSKGFTLIELMIVVGIIGVIAAILLAALGNAKSKGIDAGVKSNLRSAIAQGEILYNLRVANKSSYTGACTNGVVSGETNVKGVGESVLAAAKASGYASYGINVVGTSGTATCHDGALGWAAEVPLKSAGANKMWCVDWTGKSIMTNAGNFPVGDFSCN